MPGTVDHESYRGRMVIDGKYRLMRCIGEGAMGWVWLAWHAALDLPVALKISKPGSETSSQHEARLMATLRHPSIVAVLDSGTTPLGHSYLVMEHLDGTALSEVLVRDARLPAVAAVSLLLPILDALEHCHEHGVMHRDLKPANIFLARTGKRTQAKLLDFGVAVRLAPAEASTELVGTPGYMAPEQVRCGPELDHRADLWAFCAVLYEAVAGEPAIRGDDCLGLLLASVEPKITPLLGRTRAEALLWMILERGLQARKKDRFQSASELRDELRAIDSGGLKPCSAQGTWSAPRARRHVQWGLARPGLLTARTVAA